MDAMDDGKKPLKGSSGLAGTEDRKPKREDAVIDLTADDEDVKPVMKRPKTTETKTDWPALPARLECGVGGGYGASSLESLMWRGLPVAPWIQKGESISRQDNYGWPAKTPVPEARGGIWHAAVPKSSKRAGVRARGVYSRVGRLAGTRQIVAQVNDKTKLERGCGIGRVRPSVYGYYGGYGGGYGYNRGNNHYIWNGQQGNQATTNTESWPLYHGYRLMEASEAMCDLATEKGEALVLASEEDVEFLKALKGLNDKKNPFSERCVHAVALVGKTALEDASNGDTLTFLVGVWFKRALFGLSGHPSVKIVIDGLDPAAEVRRRRAPQETTGEFLKSAKPRDPYSIPSLLRDAESEGFQVSDDVHNLVRAMSSSAEEEEEDLPTITVQLWPHQEQNLSWCLSQESSKGQDEVPGLNGFMWERRGWKDGGDPWYYCPLAGHALLEAPPTVTGGLLADDMGFGKTVSMLALIVADLRKRPRAMLDEKGKREAGTLIVVPHSLFHQWLAELANKTPSLTVYGCQNDGDKSWKSSAQTAKVLEYDVVLVRLEDLKNLRVKPRWRRLVVDECQFVKNDSAKLAKDVAKFDAEHVWMLSGTPFTSNIEDLRGELALLRVWPFTLGAGGDGGWNNYFWLDHVARPWQNKDPETLGHLRSLIKWTMLRHSRDQRTKRDSLPLVALPPKTTEWLKVPLLPLESQVNAFLGALAAENGDARYLTPLLRAATWAGALNLATLGGLLTRRNQRRGTNNNNDAEDDDDDDAMEIDTEEKEYRKLDLRGALAEIAAHPDRTAALVAPRQLEALWRGDDDQCEYCQSIVKIRPVVLGCRHSFCKSCVEACVDAKCAVCSDAITDTECFELDVPKDIAKGARERANEKPTDVIVVEDEMSERLDLASGAALKVDETPDAVLEGFSAVPEDPVEGERRKLGLPIPFSTIPPKFRHAVAAIKRNGAAASAKLTAVLAEIRKRRADDVTAQFVVISQFSEVLDALAADLDPVRYTIEVAVTTAKQLPVGCVVVVDSTDGVIDSVEDEKCLVTGEKTGNKLYNVRTASRIHVKLPRTAIEAKWVRIANVPGSKLRPKDAESLSRGGSDNRFDVGDDDILAQRPPSTTLMPLMRVQVLGEETMGKPVEGRIVTTTGSSQYIVDVPGQGHRTLPRSKLRDLGNSTFLPAKVVAVHGASPDDPFANTIGHCRLFADPQKRGEILDHCRRDPMTSLILLTKESTSVGLNISWCNVVVLLEPFKTAAAEAQAIARVHRIGQSRPVTVLKVFASSTIDERLLVLRKNRGDLYDESLSGVCTDDAPQEESARRPNLRAPEFSQADFDLLYGVNL